MTYYEELGISADAADEEIRHAHRRLVKLLHPDQQLDAQMRRMAELQMTRINTIVDLLLDGKRRKLYDLGTRRPCGGAPIVERHSVQSQAIRKGWHIVWCGVAVTFMAGLLSISSPTEVIRSVPADAKAPIRPVHVKAPKSPAKAKAGGDLHPGPKPPPTAPVGPLDGVVGVQSTPFAQSRPDEVRHSPLETLGPVPALLPHHNVVEPDDSQSESSPKSSISLSGVWLYAGGKKSESENTLYKPEYIELRISEETGVMHGEYRSRYAVTDLPISPNVDFSFQGSVNSATLLWRGSKGSSGTISLKVINRNAIQVDWTVSDPGASGIGLQFGTGTLVRRL